MISVDGSEEELKILEDSLLKDQMDFEKVTGSDDVEFGIIRYDPSLIKFPFFIQLEFHERKGALLDFLNVIQLNQANVCYFKYTFTGERVGRALVGFDFENKIIRTEFIECLKKSKSGYRSFHEVSEKVYDRLLS